MGFGDSLKKMATEKASELAKQGEEALDKVKDQGVDAVVAALEKLSPEGLKIVKEKLSKLLGE